MKRSIATLVLIASLLFCGCSADKAYDAFLQKFIPKEEDGRARKFIELVRTGSFDKAGRMLTPDLDPEEGRAGLEQIHEVFNHDKILKVETIGVNASYFSQGSGPATKTTTLEYQIQFGDGWAAGRVVFLEKNNVSVIKSAWFNPISDSLKTLNAFTFSNKSAGQYAILALCVIFPIISIYALVCCIRTKVKRKWLWILFIIFGIGQLQVDWTSGIYNFQPLSVLLFSTCAMKASPYAPWILGIGLPVGAVIFLWRRRQLTIVETPQSQD